MIIKFKHTIVFLIMFVVAFFFQNVHSAEVFTCDHTSGPTTNNYFGVAQFQLEPLMLGTHSAISLLGEIGLKAFRGNGTIATIYNRHMVKGGYEYLGQKINYNFLSGQKKQWVHQYAAGARYEYLVAGRWFSNVFIEGQSSYADSVSLSTAECDTPTLVTLVQRHLNGSRYYNVQAGTSMYLWDCSTFSVGVGYNNIRYNRNLECFNKKINGISVDLGFNQQFCNNFALDVTGQFRRPYTYAEGLLSWHCDSYYGILTLGVFGGYVWGRDELPNSANAGVQVSFALGPYKRMRAAATCCYRKQSCTPCVPVCCDMVDPITWAAKPAVYMPMVLAIADQRVTTINICDPVVIVSTIPSHTNSDRTGIPGSTFTLDVTPFFSGSGPITYSQTSVPFGTNVGSISVSIDPVTGILTVTVGRNSNNGTTITVTATNACGSVSQTFAVQFFNP